MLEPIDLDQIELIENTPYVTVVFTTFEDRQIRREMNVVEAYFEITTNLLLGIAYKKARIEGLGEYNIRQWDTSI